MTMTVIIILSDASKPLTFNIAISLKLFSDVTTGSTCPGNNSLALCSQSGRRYDAPLKKGIAGDLHYYNQTLFHYLFWNLQFLCSKELRKKL